MFPYHLELVPSRVYFITAENEKNMWLAFFPMRKESSRHNIQPTALPSAGFFRNLKQ
jgi:hypothetical protein